MSNIFTDSQIAIMDKSIKSVVATLYKCHEYLYVSAESVGPKNMVIRYFNEDADLYVIYVTVSKHCLRGDIYYKLHVNDFWLMCAREKIKMTFEISDICFNDFTRVGPILWSREHSYDPFKVSLMRDKATDLEIICQE